MANHLIAMYQLRRIIQLELKGVSRSGISRSLGIARNTVRHYLDLLKSYFTDLNEALTWSDAALHELVQKKPAQPSVKHQSLHQQFAAYEQELSKTGVSRKLLWLEYCQQNADTIRYSQFCNLFRQWQKHHQVVMHLEHKAGEKLFIDFAGKKLHLTDTQSGELIDVEVFVATLACSQLTYVEAVYSQRKNDFLSALGNSLRYFGGVPQAIIPDNLKSAVTKADRYEPHLNESLEHFAAHYGTVIYPARSGKPRDKSLVEKSVQLAYERIYAPLRHETFTTLYALNQAITPLLEAHNQALFQGKDYSRRSRFESLEKATLHSLPSTKYLPQSYHTAKVHPDCHVLLSEDKHYYSVPHTFVGQYVKLIYNAETVEIYAHYQRIATHQRMISKHHYTTIKEHLPAQHQWLMNWSPTFFEQQAIKIGTHTHLAIQQLLQRKTYPAQSYKSCAGVLALAKKVGNQRLENACERAIAYNAISYTLIKSILDRELDQIPLVDEAIDAPLIDYQDNIRGPQHYQ
jgi:transposase